MKSLNRPISVILLFLAVAAAAFAQDQTKSAGSIDSKSNGGADDAVAGGGGITITAPTLSRPQGASFDATFRVSNVNGFGIISYEGVVTYNASVLQFNGCSLAGTIGSTGGLLCNQPLGAGTVSFVYNHTVPFINDGDGPPSDLFKVNFTAIGAIGLISTLNIQSLQVMEFAVPGAVVAGSVTISGTTAAETTVTGQVLNLAGQPISKARVFLTGTDGVPRMALTNPFGYYRFLDVPAGQNYAISATAKGYTFAPQNLPVGDEVVLFTLTADQ